MLCDFCELTELLIPFPSVARFTLLGSLEFPFNDCAETELNAKLAISNAEILNVFFMILFNFGIQFNKNHHYVNDIAL
jgi:hypothetical protein